MEPRKAIKEIKQKNVSFITVYTFDNRFLHSHKQLYPKLIIEESHLPTITSTKISKN